MCGLTAGLCAHVQLEDSQPVLPLRFGVCAGTCEPMDEAAVPCVPSHTTIL